MNPYFSINREAIWAGLFSYFQGYAPLASQFISMGRRHIQPPELLLVSQPAFFLVQVKESHEPPKGGMPTRLCLHGFIILYVPAPVIDEDIGQETVLAATTLNTIFKAIDDALQPDNPTTGKFTIGGLATHCWIEGETDMDPGLFGQQAAAILPIKILVP